MLLPPVTAHLALDRAAPHELAVALLLHVAYSRLVAAAAAQQLAAVEAVRRLVAQAAVGAHDAGSGGRSISHVG